MTRKSAELIAAYFTLAGDIYPFGPTEISPIPFEDRVEAAAKAGYKGFGLIHADAVATAERLGWGEMRRILDGSGMKHVEMEFLDGWFLEGPRREKSDRMRKQMLEAAHTLGMRHLKVAPGLGVDLSNPTTDEMTPNIPHMQEAFGNLCLEAAEVGVGLVLEVMPFSNLRTLETARAVVEGAGQPNGGLLIDIWHMARGGIAFADLAAKLPGKFIKAVELDDAEADVVGELWEDTIYRRRLPGEGVLNPSAFIAAVQATGYDGPWGVEILSESFRKLPLAEMAKRSFDTTIAQFDRVAT